MISRQNNLEANCNWVAIPVERVFLHWYGCGADGRSVHGHVITKFSRIGRLLYFLTYGAPLAPFARESSTINEV